VVSGSNPARFESNTTDNFVQLFTNEGNNNRVEICNRTGGRLALYTTGGGDALNILKTGEVGIGTTTPSQKLDVNGNAKANTFIGSLTGTASAIANDSVTNVKVASGAAIAGTKIAPDFGSQNVVTTGDVVTTGNVAGGVATASAPIHGQRASASAGFAVLAKTTGVSNESGVYFDASNNAYLEARNGSGTLAVSIKSSGDSFINSGHLGIGTTTPSQKLDVRGGIQTKMDSNEGTALTLNNEGVAGGKSFALISTGSSNGSGAGHFEIFAPNNGNVNFVTTGNVGIGTQSPTGKLDVNGTTKSTKLVIDNTSNDDKVFIKGFNNNNTDDGIRFVPSIVTAGDTAAACSFMSTDGTTLRGTISISTTGVSYGSVSDYRLKSDVVPISEALQQLQQLNPVNFEWVENGERSDGFVAHEVQAVVPNAVTGAKDAVDANGNPIYQQVDYSKLVPILVASVQELKKKVAQLESR
jgi:hypothetical protein